MIGQLLVFFSELSSTTPRYSPDKPYVNSVNSLILCDPYGIIAYWDEVSDLEKNLKDENSIKRCTARAWFCLTRCNTLAFAACLSKLSVWCGESIVYKCFWKKFESAVLIGQSNLEAFYIEDEKIGNTQKCKEEFEKYTYNINATQNGLIQ